MNITPINNYFITLPSISYFINTICHLRDLVLKLNEETLGEKFKFLNDINDEIIDLLLFLQDIFSLKINNINYAIINSLFFYIILPMIVSTITSNLKVDFFLTRVN